MKYLITLIIAACSLISCNDEDPKPCNDCLFVQSNDNGRTRTDGTRVTVVTDTTTIKKERCGTTNSALKN